MSDHFWMICYGESHKMIVGECKVGKLPEDKRVELVGFAPEAQSARIQGLSAIPMVDTVDFIFFEGVVNTRRGQVIASPGFIRAHRQFVGHYQPLIKHDNPHFTLRNHGEIEIYSLTLPCRIGFSGNSDCVEIHVELEEWIAIREGWTFNVVGDNSVIGAGIVMKAGA